MRPSSLIALLIAVVVGLLGISVARSLNLFGREPIVAGRPPVKILVANLNIVKGALMDVKAVVARPLREDEYPAYERDSKKYLPPLATAVYLRVTKESIQADEPITEDKLEPFEPPDSVSKRIAPGMQAATVDVRLEDSAGGLIRAGDWVDVFFVSVINGPGIVDSERQVLMASKALVIVKRNSTLPYFAPLPAGKPVPFTLETTPELASLIEFSRDKGDFRLVLLPESEKKLLDAERKVTIAAATSSATPSPSASNAANRRAAEAIVLAGAVGKAKPISDDDLVRLFRLQAPRAPDEPPPIQSIQLLGGTRIVGEVYHSQGRMIANSVVQAARGQRLVAGVLNSPEPTVDGDGNLIPAGSEVFQNLLSGSQTTASLGPVVAGYTFRKPTPPPAEDEDNLSGESTRPRRK
jgi:Flp pilus assembly protein CpaB